MYSFHWKIFDEVLVNAADNKQRDKNTSVIVIDVRVSDSQCLEISVYNNGSGVPVTLHPIEKDLYIPTLLFGHLLTGSNFDDSKVK